MEPIELYRNTIRQLPRAEERWFPGAIERYRRRRTDISLREVCGRSLHQTLAEAEEFCRQFSDVDLLDAVQEANGALVDAIKTFAGSSLEDFETYLHQEVQARLYEFLFSQAQTHQ